MDAFIIYFDTKVLTLDNGITVYWSKPYKTLIILDPSKAELFGNLCGLCGNRNEVKYDDIKTDTGELVSNLNGFFIHILPNRW